MGNANAQRAQPSTSDAHSFPPTPDPGSRRRGSEVSTSAVSMTSMSLSAYSPPCAPNRHRPSVASSYTNTIGDLSTSSMPLLRQSTGERDDAASARSRMSSPSREGAGGGSSGTGGWTGTGRSASIAPSSSSRGYLPGSSSASMYSDDNVSVHSYPPYPRARAGSGSLKNWAREIEHLGAMGQVRRRGSGDSKNDAWPSFVTQSYIHQPITRPAPAYFSALSSYSFPASPDRLQVPPPLPVPANPLAPLRKRLIRALDGSGRRLHTEVQLLLELIDALEHCIASFSPSSERSSADSAASTSSSSAAPHTSTSSDGHLHSLAPTTACAHQRKAILVDEVRLLARELVELVPDAQRCLTNGHYGPLASPSSSTKVLLQSLSDERSTTPGWWPRRLARDCRALLEEAGLPTGTNLTAWLLAASMSDEADEQQHGEKEGEGEAREGAPPLKVLAPIGEGGATSAAEEQARREELLKQGKQRWAAYRQKQAVMDQYTEHASPPL
ncbi:hypothetical protein JCM5296_004201 [Sporobolomyces johnsonii]